MLKGSSRTGKAGNVSPDNMGYCVLCYHILCFRYVDPPKPPENWKEIVGETKVEKYQFKQLREFLVKWVDMSYWHCSWISELMLDVYHPQVSRERLTTLVQLSLLHHQN